MQTEHAGFNVIMPLRFQISHNIVGGYRNAAVTWFLIALNSIRTVGSYNTNT